jgi:hypothetical protein
MSQAKRCMVAMGVIAILASAGASLIEPMPHTPPTTIAREAEAVGIGVRRIRRLAPPSATSPARRPVVAFGVYASGPAR